MRLSIGVSEIVSGGTFPAIKFGTSVPQVQTISLSRCNPPAATLQTSYPCVSCARPFHPRSQSTSPAPLPPPRTSNPFPCHCLAAWFLAKLLRQETSLPEWRLALFPFTYPPGQSISTATEDISSASRIPFNSYRTCTCDWLIERLLDNCDINAMYTDILLGM